MSKQSQANTIFKNGTTIGASRKAMIDEIVRVVGCSPAYASTLYNNARKANGAPSIKKPSTKKPKNGIERLGIVKEGKINEFNKSNLKMLRNEIDEALEAVLSKHGLSHRTGNIRFSTNDFGVKLEVFTGSTDDKKQRAFEKDAWRYGLESSDFGRQFKSGTGEIYTITGIQTRAKKYPILGKNAQGKGYKFPANTVKNGLI